MYICWGEYFQENSKQCSDKELGRVVLEIERIALLAVIAININTFLCSRNKWQQSIIALSF